MRCFECEYRMPADNKCCHPKTRGRQLSYWDVIEGAPKWCPICTRVEKGDIKTMFDKLDNRSLLQKE